MSEITDANPVEQLEATDAEVTDAVEALMRSVEEPAGKAAPTPGNNDALIATVDTLVGNVAALVRSVELLTEKAPSATVAPEPLAVESVAAIVDEVEESGTFKGVVFDAILTLTAFLGVGLAGAGFLRSQFDVIALALALGGCAVFVASSLATSPRMSRVRLIKHVGGLVLVAAGLGFVVGGIQFFGDEPARAAKLIPLGIPLFITGFLICARFKPSTEHLSWLAGVGLWVCMGLLIGLGALASSMADRPADAEPETSANAVAAPDEHAAPPAVEPTTDSTHDGGVADASHATASADHSSTTKDADKIEAPTTTGHTEPVKASAEHLGETVAKVNASAGH